MSSSPAPGGRGRGRGMAASPSPSPVMQQRPQEPGPSSNVAQRVGSGRGSPMISPVINAMSNVQISGGNAGPAPKVTAVVAGNSPPKTNSPPKSNSPPGSRPPGRRELNEQIRNAMPRKKPTDPVMAKQLATRELTVATNYFKITTKNPYIFKYSVAFDPPLDSKHMRYAMVASHSGIIGETIAFDGMQLFLLRKLESSVTYVKSIRSTDNQEFEITIKLTEELKPAECFQLYNIVFRRILRLMKLKEIGRNHFDPARSVRIPQYNMELWPGYVTAIGQYDGGAFLNIDTISKVLRTDTVLDHISGLRRRFNRNQAEFQEAVNQSLVGQIVLTRYNNKTYHIDGIAWDLTPRSTFRSSDGSTVTYFDYYLKTYTKTITNLDQPLIMNKGKKSFGGTPKVEGEPEKLCFLVPELCCMTGITEETKADFNIMKALAEHTIVAPGIRKKGLEDFIAACLANPETATELQKWNIEFSRTMANVPARIFNPEKIFFKNKSVVADAQTAEWTRDMKLINLIQSKPFNNWVLIYCTKNKDQAIIFTQNMSAVGRPLGVEVGEPRLVSLAVGSPMDYLAAIKECHIPGQTQFVVCMLPDPSKARYDAIKKYAVSDVGIVTQCVVAKTMMKEKSVVSACVKLLMQINVKLGGQLWGVEIPLKGCMVMGIDVYHDSLNKGTSVAGIISSTNEEMTKYHSSVVFQRSHQELVDGLKQHFTTALDNYKNINMAYPQRVIVFRDGVGDGQLPLVVNHEVGQMTDVFAALGILPKLTVVVVQKRINTRFMAGSGQQIMNPTPGTLVTEGCTSKDGYDYFLSAQSVKQGTTTPTHYHVIYDTSGLQPIHVQALTYKLTHLYYNWPGTIRVPAPCMYAHKIAFLIGQSVHRDPNASLSNNLYYL